MAWLCFFASSMPSRSMRPSLRAMVPVIAARRVDLPAPLGPSSATVSPFSTASETPCSTGAAPYEACRSESRSIAKVGLHHGGLRAHFLRRAFGDARAEVEHHHAAGERQQEAHVVLDQQHRDAALRDAADDAGQAVELGRREPRRRLVEQDDARLAGKRARDLEQAALAERQRADVGVAQPGEADEFDQLFGAPALPLLFQFSSTNDQPCETTAKPGVRPHHHVLQHRHAAERPVVLEGAHDAQARDAVRRQAEDRLAGKADLALVGVVGAGDDVEGGGLAGAVRADHAEDLALAQVEVETGHGGQPAEALGQAPYLENRSHRPISPLGCRRMAATTSRPNTSWWWWPTSGESQNGSRNSRIAPMAAPAWRPAPPTITMNRIRKALSRPKIGGFTVLSTKA